MSKRWKKFGIIILAVAVLLAIFDIVVFTTDKIMSNKRVSVYREAEKAGYDEAYTICSRQGDIVIDGQAYLCFNAHRHAILDGDYDEDLIVSKDDKFEDEHPYQKENLEIFAKEIKRVTDNYGNDYTLIDVYRIDKCRTENIDAWFWNALLISIVVLPIELVLGIIWVIHFIVYKKRQNL